MRILVFLEQRLVNFFAKGVSQFIDAFYLLQKYGISNSTIYFSGRHKYIDTNIFHD